MSAALVRCATVARRNHGVIGQQAALGCGLNEQQIRRLVRQGYLHRVFPGAYLVAGAPLTRLARLEAVKQWAGGDCVFSHRTAARLLGLDLPSGASANGAIDITAYSGRVAPGIKVHRLAPDDRPRTVWTDGFRATSVERTVIDLFAVLPSSGAELALEDALRKRLTTLDRLWETARDVGRQGRKGTIAFRKALLTRDHRDGSLQSRMETRLLAILRSIPDDDPATQYEVRIANERFFLDFAYPDVKLGVEAHSLRWHYGEVRWRKDLRRDRLLKGAGWTLLYYPWDDIDLRPDEIADEVQRIRSQLTATQVLL